MSLLPRRDALAAAFSSKTKMLLLNSPHNPTGDLCTGYSALYVDYMTPCSCHPDILQPSYLATYSRINKVGID